MYKCIYCSSEFIKKNSIIVHQKACRSNPNRIPGKNQWSCGLYEIKDTTKKKLSKSSSSHKHSEETKNKISLKRKEFLNKNPHMVPYLLNHSSKGDSYPEKYFEELFENENIVLLKKFQIGLYQLDFCNLTKKIDIEVDGEQHYLDNRIVNSDIRRTEYLHKNGWSIYRIRWSEYQKKTLYEKQLLIVDLKKILGL